MLYEVITLLPLLTIGVSALLDTLSGGLSLDNMSLRHLGGLFVRDGAAWAAISTSLTLALVITSYSIHYTKLYDIVAVAHGGVHGHPARAEGMGQQPFGKGQGGGGQNAHVSRSSA